MRKQIFEKTRCSIILSGNLLEVYDFQFPLYYNFSALPPKARRQITDAEIAENRRRSRGRSRETVRRLVRNNFGAWKDERDKPYYSKFLTLTFRKNIQTVKEANPHFTLFIKRLNYELFKTKKSVIQYVAVIEFQPISGRVHYHVVLFNLPFIDRYIDVFNRVWDQGFMLIKTIKDEAHAANYITKYMTKEDDKRLQGEKSYFCSRGLKRSAVMRKEFRTLAIKRFASRLKPCAPTRKSKNKRNGEVHHAFYDIGNNPEVKKYILANQE